MKRRNLTKGVIPLLLSGILLLSMPSFALAKTNKQINISETIILLEDEKIPVPVYTIGEQEYVPLNAIMEYFGVKSDFDEARGCITFQFDESIKMKDNYDYGLDSDELDIINSTHEMEFDNNKFTLAGTKLVNGHNFIRVSELGDLFGYSIIHNDQSNTFTMTNDYFSDYFSALDDSTLDNYSKFMQENTINLSFDDMEELKAIDFDKYSVYLIGENHAISKNTDVKLNFIKFLHENYGVRFIISESGYCDTIGYNNFLKTGDRSIIDEDIESIRGTFSYTKENYDFYIKLYEYNQTLPEDERIIFYGIDVQHNWVKGLEEVKKFFGNDSMPEIIESTYDLICKKDSKNTDIKIILDNIEKESNVFEQYFGDSFIDFKFGIRSVWQSMVFYEEGNFSVREQFIHENIRDMYSAFEMEKCFGMFGGAHVMLDGMFDDQKCLANYINTELEPTMGKVLSIMCIYEDSYYMNRENGSSIPVQPNYGKTLNSMLAKSVSGELGICPAGEIAFEGGLLSDMFQYMLCIKNSPASTPFKQLSN